MTDDKNKKKQLKSFTLFNNETGQSFETLSQFKNITDIWALDQHSFLISNNNFGNPATRKLHRS